MDEILENLFASAWVEGSHSKRTDGIIPYTDKETKLLAQAKQALQPLLVRERIDELQNLNWANLTWRDDMANFILYSDELHKLRDERIAELKVELKKELK